MVVLLVLKNIKIYLGVFRLILTCTKRFYIKTVYT